MSLKDDFQSIKDFIELQNDFLHHNKILFNVLEGDLLKYVLIDLKNQLSPRSYEVVQQRVAPINLLKKVVDKLSKIYGTAPARNMVSGTESDKKLVEYYEKRLNFNQKMNISNENFNSYKNTWIEPIILDSGKEKIRSITSDRFLVYSNDKSDQTEPTHLIKFIGQRKSRSGQIVDVILVTTNEEMIIWDMEGDVLFDMMKELDNPGGINPFETLPGTYINRSQNLLIPKPDSDTLTMTKLFPILLSDLNYAVMFQSFSIIYGIDLTEENLKMAPNAFWRLKSDKKGVGDKKPSIGMIKPEVDIDQVLNLIGSTLALWLQSRNIRPGTVGQLNTENFISGISKIVDEMDTFEDRQSQISYFKPAEEDLWNNKIPIMHNEWVSQGLIKDKEAKKLFSSDFKMEIEFVDQRPMFDRSSVLDEIEKEIDIGILSKKRAMKRANPDKSDAEIDEMLAEVEEERTIEMDVMGGSGGHTHTDPDTGEQFGPEIEMGEGIHSHNGLEPAKTGEGHTHKITATGKQSSGPVPLGEKNVNSEEDN